VKKILVTGASGYIGARLTQYLSDRGHKITALCFPKIPKDKDWLDRMEEVLWGDVREEKTLSAISERCFDVVIHLISLDHTKSNGNPNDVASINVLPTWNLLHLFSQKRLDTFIYFSTFQVYGKVENTKITEDYRPFPHNAYGLTHLMSEMICRFFRSQAGLRCLNVRLSNSYGSPIFLENECWSLVINDLCRTAFKENEIRLLSDGSPLRDFIHISDVCGAVETLINAGKNQSPHDTFHVSSGVTLTIMELAWQVKNLFEERYKKEVPIRLPRHIIAGEIQKYRSLERYVLDHSRIKALGFKPRTSLREGIQELFDYLESVYGLRK
jgi:nucleoside-diphosphate-sugar epimerase